MNPNFPLQFNYIPYPLWRRRWPEPLKALLNPLWPGIYPVEEDTQPPADSAALTDYLVRYKLMPDYEMPALHNALQSSPAEVEYVPSSPPESAPETPVRVPAQWEQMAAVMVNWPVLYPPLWSLHAEMVEAIAPVAEVHVIIPAGTWAHAAHLYLSKRGRIGGNIDRVRFIVMPVDDIWVRDHGPIIGYDAGGERRAISAIYDHLPNYPQTRDNALPLRWAAHTGMAARGIHLHTEGGNLWTDGAGTLIMTEQIFNENPGHDRASLENYLHTIFDYEKLIITPRMNLEETGHVDLLVKLADAETALVSAPTTASSAEQLRITGTIFRRETNANGARYRVIELPTPPLYLNWGAFPIRRSYTNSLTINGRVLVPIYELSTDDEALRIYEQAMPGHEIIPINCRIGANGGGAVHCLTKEIPAALDAPKKG